MDDLDELKGRVERATLALSEREAEEQGRHAQLISLFSALEAKSLEAREEKEAAEARLAAVQAENEELRGLLASLLDAVETGSRSRFADAIYALEARISGVAGSRGEATDAPSEDPGGAADEVAAAGLEAAPDPEFRSEQDVEAELAAEPEPENASGPDAEAGSETGAEQADESERAAGPDAAAAEPSDEELDDFTAELAASCAVEQELVEEARELRSAAADDARILLEKIRRQVEGVPEPGETPGDPKAPSLAETLGERRGATAEAEEAAARPSELDDAVAALLAEGDSLDEDADEPEAEERVAAAAAETIAEEPLPAEPDAEEPDSVGPVGVPGGGPSAEAEPAADEDPAAASASPADPFGAFEDEVEEAAFTETPTDDADTLIDENLWQNRRHAAS